MTTDNEDKQISQRYDEAMALATKMINLGKEFESIMTDMLNWIEQGRQSAPDAEWATNETLQEWVDKWETEIHTYPSLYDQVSQQFLRYAMLRSIEEKRDLFGDTE